MLGERKERRGKEKQRQRDKDIENRGKERVKNEERR
jgi:hypothetical protein